MIVYKDAFHTGDVWCNFRGWFTRWKMKIQRQNMSYHCHYISVEALIHSASSKQVSMRILFPKPAEIIDWLSGSVQLLTSLRTSSPSFSRKSSWFDVSLRSSHFLSFSRQRSNKRAKMRESEGALLGWAKNGDKQEGRAVGEEKKTPSRALKRPLRRHDV